MAVTPGSGEPLVISLGTALPTLDKAYLTMAQRRLEDSAAMGKIDFARQFGWTLRDAR